MIRQHTLQQQRLGYNHERLLERYERLLAPSVSQFSTFGASTFPGRNYEQHLGMMSSNQQDPARKSLAALSRAGVGVSNETYLWNGSMNQSEALPRNINSVMQHSRQQRIPLVHAEKFEPVQVYEHPVFGRTPAYIRPVPSEQKSLERLSNDDDDEENESSDDTDDDMSVNRDRVQDAEKRSTAIDDDDGTGESAPRGYISYKKWKTKYEHLIPVNPLLYSVYTRRPNGSIHSYGRAMYSSPNRQRQLSGDNELTSATPSDDGSDASTVPGDAFSSSKQRYNRLKSHLAPTRLASRSLAPIESDEESSDDEDAPADSPVPFLSRNRSNPMLATGMPSFLDAATVSNSGPNNMSASNVPPAPPMPSTISFATAGNAGFRQAASTASNSTVVYQTPSSVSALAPSVAGSVTTANAPRAVTFGGSSSVPVPPADVSSSSSDSDDDDEKKKRRRRKKRLAAGNGDADSSSSDD